jgi:hypothetical protein
MIDDVTVRQDTLEKYQAGVYVEFQFRRCSFVYSRVLLGRKM